MNSNAKHWFGAKAYGLGWGLPVTWQGWVVLAAWLVAMAVSLAFVPPGLPRLACAGASTLVLVAIMAWKGERPFRWRWGHDT